MNIADVDINALSEKEAMIAYDFWYAYNRPYPEALTWREYRAMGYEPIEWTKVGMEEIEESYDECIGYTLDEDGFVVPLQADERADWLQRRINSWTRTKEWKL